MSTSEWEMVAYAGILITLVSLAISFLGLDKIHRIFFCVFFPLAVQLILFGIAYLLLSEQGWLGTAVLLMALAVAGITLMKTWELAMKHPERDTLSLAISSMLRAAFIPLMVTLLALITF